MALADYCKKNNAKLEKFNFDTKNSVNVKLKDIANGEHLVKAMFYGDNKQGKQYATIYIEDTYFFVPDFKVAQVVDMCKDAEVRQAINDSKLALSVYEYDNDFGTHKSFSFVEVEVDV